MHWYAIGGAIGKGNAFFYYEWEACDALIDEALCNKTVWVERGWLSVPFMYSWFLFSL